MDPHTHDPTAPRVDPSVADDRVDDDAPATDEETPGEAFKAAQTRLAELAEYVSYYLSTKIDALKLSIRNAAIYAALGIVGLIAAAALVVTAVVLVCRGLAEALTTVLGGRVWLGDILAGVLFLGAIGIGVWIGIHRMLRASRERTVKKYAARQQQQRAKFGQDVQQGGGDAPK